MNARQQLRLIASGFLLVALQLCVAGCGNPRDDSIVYKKLTPEEFAKLPPEERETPEVMENMGDAWKDPNTPEGASNPSRKGRAGRTK